MASHFSPPCMLATESGMLGPVAMLAFRLLALALGSRATQLSAEGAVRVFPDLSNADLFLRSVYEITKAT